MKDLYNLIRVVPDFPKSGISFYDITTLLENAQAFQLIIDKLAEPYQQIEVDKFVGIDARGFLLAAPLAYKLGKGLAIVRKKGKLPYQTFSQQYELEYGADTIEMHHDTIDPGEKVAIIDDVLATGGTMQATIDLLHQFEAEIVVISFLAELGFLNGKDNIKHYPIYSLLTFNE
ncbi:MAG: adenine phosphoribosyltransferase [Candidatus Buchananbacteria bacterium]|nr:adenine phosphoribosyltransferase [Candidatus Buchananbacteria bacterium]